MQASLSPPVAPPIKKQRSGNTPQSDRISLKGDEMYAARKAELRRLQEKRAQLAASGTEQALLTRAREQLSGPNHPPEARPAPPPPAMPMPMPMPRARHSDIFPSVLKPPSQEHQRAPPPPPPGGAGPPPVVRRLDVSFADTPKPGDQLRSKSAPPTRPPPPPPPTPATPAAQVAEAPEPRGFVGRPSPVTPGTGGPPPPPPQSFAGRTPGPHKPKSPSVVAAGRTPFPKASTAPPAPTPHHHHEESPAPPVSTPFPKAQAAPMAVAAAPTPYPSKQESAHVPTPFVATTAGVQPSTGRRDLLRSMREGADTPPSKATTPIAPTNTSKSPASPELRMQQELLQTQKDKKEAMDKLAQMSQDMQKLREQNQSAQKLEAVIQMADAEGETVAVEWARKHVRGQQVGFLSPMATLLKSPGSARNIARAMSPLSMANATPWKRASTPHPKHKSMLLESSSDGDKEFLVQAAECAVFEFGVEGLASYIVRRPFGLADEKELWFSAGQKNTKMYERTADVCKSSTLEVAAKIEADGSVVALYGEAMVRHQTAGDGMWNDFGNVDDRDKPLGSVTYIDSDANEKDYSLDEVFEGAVAARNHYCSSLVVAAAAMRSQKASQLPALVVEQSPPVTMSMPMKQSPKPETSEICVGTEDLPFPAPTASAANGDPTPQENGKGKDKDRIPAKKKKAPPPPADDNDVLSVFMSMFFGTIFSVIWTIFVRIPLQILATTFYLLMGGMLLSMVWLYLAEDNGAGAMGAFTDSMYNRPGIL